MTDSQVNELLENFIQSWNSKDVAVFGRCFAEEADFVDIVGNLAEGRPQIEALHVFPFTHGLKNARLSRESLRWKSLGQGLISGDLRWRNSGAVGREGTPAPDQFGNLFFLLQEKDGQLKFLSARNTNYSGDLGKPAA